MPCRLHEQKEPTTTELQVELNAGKECPLPFFSMETHLNSHMSVLAACQDREDCITARMKDLDSCVAWPGNMLGGGSRGSWIWGCYPGIMTMKVVVVVQVQAGHWYRGEEVTVTVTTTGVLTMMCWWLHLTFPYPVHDSYPYLQSWDTENQLFLHRRWVAVDMPWQREGDRVVKNAKVCRRSTEHVVWMVFRSVSDCSGDRCISDDNWNCVAFPMITRKTLHASGKVKPTDKFKLRKIRLRRINSKHRSARNALIAHSRLLPERYTF